MKGDDSKSNASRPPPPASGNQRVAAIDVGTNTALLSICRWTGTLKSLHEEGRVVRLGEGIDRSGSIHPAAQARLESALCSYRDEIARQGVTDVVIAGTSASRDAANGPELVERVRDLFGWEYRILTGVEEARMTFAGSLCMLGSVGAGVVVDVGGGSTEMVKGVTIPSVVIQDAVSMDVGSVRLTERYFSRIPAAEEEIERARQHTTRLMTQAVAQVGTTSVLVASAGTAVILARLNSGERGQAMSSAASGWTLSLAEVESWCLRLLALSSEEVLQLDPSLMKGREDVFAAGVLILLSAMRSVGARELLVSAGGLRHGLALSHFERA